MRLKRQYDTEIENENNTRQNTMFTYGTDGHDCFSGTARLIRRATGVDIRGRLVRYVNKAQAQERLDTHGGIEGVIDHVLQGETFQKLRGVVAENGDIVTFSYPQRPDFFVMGFVFRNRIWTPDGLGYRKVRLNRVDTIWRLEKESD